MKNQKGFTRIEILIAVTILGLLGIMAVVSVLSARSVTRDAVRLSDIRQVQNGLEAYFINTNSYPVVESSISLGIANTSCLSVKGFGTPCLSGDKVYLDVIPSSPQGGLKHLVECSGYSDVYCYISDGVDYRIQFELENKNSLLGLQKGINCASPMSLDAGSCSSIISVQ